MREGLFSDIGAFFRNVSIEALAKKEVQRLLRKASRGSLWFPRAHSPMMKNDRSLF